MRHLEPFLSNRSFTLALLFFTVLTTQQLSTLQFDFGYEYYPYFIAVGVLIFNLKVFFSTYYSLLRQLQINSVFGLLTNLGLVAAQLWLLQTSLQYLVTSYYPEDSFRALAISGGLFLVQAAVNDSKKIRTMVVITALYYGGVYLAMRNFGIASNSTLGLQSLSFLVPLLELGQLFKLLTSHESLVYPSKT